MIFRGIINVGARIMAKILIVDDEDHIRFLYSEELTEAGSREITWNGEDDSGRAVAAGVYVCRLKAGGLVETGRMVLLK